MLHNIDEQGNLEYHCHRPDCEYHHCAGLAGQIECAHHGTQHKSATPLQTHISHEQVEWVDATTVQLPPCPACGSRMALRVGFTDAEIAPPIIERDPSGKITKVVHVGAVNLTRIYDHAEKRVIMDEARRQVLRQHGIPEALIEALIPPVVYFERVIDRVEPHPAIARHQELERQLTAIGKRPAG